MWGELCQIARMIAAVWKILDSREKTALATAGVIMLATGALGSIPPILIGRLVDEFFKTIQPNLGKAWPVVLVVAAIVVTREALHVVRKYLVEQTCTQVERRVTTDLVGHILKLNLEWLGSELKVGGLHGRMRRSIEGLVRMMKLGFLDLLPATTASLCAVVAVVMKEPPLAVVMSLVVPAGLFIVLWQVVTQKGIRIELLRAKEDVDGKLVELLSGIEYVRAANTLQEEVRRVGDVTERLRRRELRHHAWMALFDSAKYLNETFFQLLVLCISIYLASQRLITVGDILSYSMLFTAITNPLREFHRVLDEGHESSLRVADLLGLRRQPVDPSFARCRPASAPRPGASAVVECDKLAVEYVGRENGSGTVLRGVTCRIEAGQWVAITGPSGSGKSTLVKALVGLVPVSRGAIRIGGRALSSMSREEIASIFGYVGQEPFLFSGSIAENITYGCGSASIEEVAEAARAVNMHEEILRMGGYSARVSERGGNLSGGQRQRIAIARMFLRKVSVLVLDEGTSALDAENEQRVRSRLREALAGITVIEVAHRTAALHSADDVLVMKDGRIVARGPYSSVMAAGV